MSFIVTEVSKTFLLVYWKELLK